MQREIELITLSDLNFKKNIVMIGAGGHARVLQSIIYALGKNIHIVCDPGIDKKENTWINTKLVNDEKIIEGLNPKRTILINGLGQVPKNNKRKVIFNKFKRLGFTFMNIQHPFSWVADSVEIDEGVQIMAGVVIQPYSKIGKNTIINSSSSIDHDCIISSNVHIAPKATLCGSVFVGENSFIGSGSTIIPKIRIEKNCLIGAGITITKNLKKDSVALGKILK